ncbi:MAG: 4Fe-4S binding protein [Firmicutes bacterium]|nr:4Fe-4S binding protein [Bacillota bacterium]
MDIRIDQKLCKQCGICAEFCPVQALELSELGEPEYRYPERCVGCQMCYFRCPDFALRVYDLGGEANGA